MNRLVAPSIEISRTSPAVAGLRQTDEPLDAIRHADQRIHRLAVLGARKLQRDREAEIGNERERMRRIDGERRQQRKNVAEKVILEPGLLRLADIGPSISDDAGFRERRPQLAPLRLLIARPAASTASAMRASCSAGVRPSGLLVPNAGAHLAPEGRRRAP